MSAKSVPYGAIASGLTSIAKAGYALHQHQKFNAASQSQIDPMAGMASGSDLHRYAMQNGAFFLGSMHEDHKADFTAGVHDDRHIFVVGGNRAGKGLTLAIPNALTWEGPFFGIDPKGEIASIAALRRATVQAAQGTGTSVRYHLGQPVAILDPLGEVKGPARAFCVDYNPLADIDMNEGGGVQAIRAVASSIIKPEDGNSAHFSETADTLLGGIIEVVKLTEPPVRQNLLQCRSILMSDFDTLRGRLEQVETAAGLARDALTIMDRVGEDEFGSFCSTLSRNLKWLAEPDFQSHLAPSPFSLTKAVQAGGSIFAVLPPHRIAENAGWLRMIVRTVIDAKQAMGNNQKGPQMLCLLDEFAALGTFSTIEDNAAYMAGYGIKLVPIIQNLGQIKKLYPRNWETFLGNAGAIIGFGLNDLETEQYFSDRLGKIMVTETGVSHNVSGLAGGGQGASSSRHERPVRFANEIHEQGARETGRAFVIPASGRGFMIRRRPYTAFPAGFYDAPDFITDWENKHWKGF